ncbi:ABC transporter permease [Bifidobacterium vansinderenii]|uniref:ABC transporter permease n=1 Tax=Bifidobacterium vansinderenii TaxID=1984871 RepID=A0A229VZ90_9BIFI|nr:iron export ABC transporter permease subunit FetB [Bifidobacterium vansinderenii]OXN00938.1 ABC transporter permease [Bifidobacterium vansinderenii]
MSGINDVLVTGTEGAASDYPIDNWGLLVALLLVALAAVISAVLKLGVERRLLWATVRSLVQLLAMGLIISYVIQVNQWWLVFALLGVMIIAAVQITLTRGSGLPKGLVLPVFLTLLASAVLMFSVVVELIIRPQPWYAPQVVVTMVGMLLGNVVSAIAVAITRLFDDMRTRRYEIETMLAWGATPLEAAMPSITSAVRLGLIPTIAQLASSGIVLIPGMMAGQIIAGGDPVQAARYQFVVLAVISSLTALADTLIVMLVYRVAFTENHRLRTDL